MDTNPPAGPVLGATSRLPYDPARDEMVDLANLLEEDTGIAGTIFISTRMAAHGPRIKWWPGRPNRDGACLVVTLEDPPRPLNSGLVAKDARRGSSEVVAWASRNRAALLDYRENGALWSRSELNRFLDGLAKLP
jgi:hypothetical protein